MLDIKKVLFTTDFSELANHALPYAIKMARIFDAELVMLHAVTLYEHDPNDPTHHFPSLERYCEEVEVAADKKFQVCIESAGDTGVKVSKVIVQGISPHAAILEYLGDNKDIGMVVMSSHGRSGLSHMLLGSVTENVVRYADRPVLVVKKPEHEIIDPETGELTIKRILFPIDFSEDALRPMELLKFIAEQHQSRVYVFHSIDVEIPPVYYSSGINSILELDPNIKERVEKKMRETLESELNALETEFVVEEGRATERIREFIVNENIDLVVMATSGSHGIGEFLFGSTAARVIQKALCPVLVV